MIDGTLRDSFTHSLPVPDGAGGWVCTLSSGLVYSRIQELGGWAGRGHRSHLPPRPYLKPAALDAVASGDLRDAFARFWAEAISA
jgi:phage gpG-like protein